MIAEEVKLRLINQSNRMDRHSLHLHDRPNGAHAHMKRHIIGPDARSFLGPRVPSYFLLGL